jgi:hypothetical protein
VQAGRRWWSRLGVRGRRDLLIAALLLFCYGFFQQQPAWNEYSRYDLVRALLEQGTTRIDAYEANTGDKALFQGHWYSDKAPGTALLGVPVYSVLRLSASLAGQDAPGDVAGVQALAFLESGVATAVLVLLLIRFIGPFVGEAWATVVGLGYGLGSIAFPFATMFFGHAASTAALFAAFFVLHRLKHGSDRRAAYLAGFLAGWAVLIEIPLVLGVGALFVYALFQGRGVVARFVAGGLPLLIVLLGYDWLTFGSPLSIGYQYTPAFASQNAQGLVSIVWPRLDTTWDLLFSPRGLLRLAPWFALAPLGLVAIRRRDARFEVVLAAVICAAFLTYNSGALNPFGGWTPGPRYLLPALPFAAVLVAFVSPQLRLVAGLAMAFAAAVFFVATATMPNAPERYADPLLQLWLPRFLAGELAETAAWVRWGLGGLAALSVLAVGLAFGVLAVALSFGREHLASRTAGRASIVLAAAGLAFSLPFPPLSAVVLATVPAGRQPVEIVELGHVIITVGGAPEVEVWTRVENRGDAIAGARLQFTAWDGAGTAVWTAWYGDVAITARSRRLVAMTWQPGDIPPGTYRLGFSVSDAAASRDYAAVVGADPVRLDP